MKKLFPLMFALIFANKLFAMETEVVVADETTKSEVVATEVVAVEETTRSVVLDETTKAVEEAKVVYDELKTRGLTDAQIVAKVEETLRNETTENVSRSILDQHNQEKILLFLAGAVAGVLVFEGSKWAYNSYKSVKPAKPADKPAEEPAK
ncbi:MAG: hypothetical protein V1646_00315 [bacterium]